MSDIPQSAVGPVAAETAAPPKIIRSGKIRGNAIWGTGRRKTAVARVKLMAGDGKFLVNGREVDKFFSEVIDRADALAPFTSTGTLGKYNVMASVAGGGHTGQAGAVRLGLARALLMAKPEFEATLRDAGYLTRDSREVESKKYGRRKARRRFQFSKR